MDSQILWKNTIRAGMRTHCTSLRKNSKPMGIMLSPYLLLKTGMVVHLTSIGMEIWTLIRLYIPHPKLGPNLIFKQASMLIVNNPPSCSGHRPALPAILETESQNLPSFEGSMNCIYYVGGAWGGAGRWTGAFFCHQSKLAEQGSIPSWRGQRTNAMETIAKEIIADLRSLGYRYFLHTPALFTKRGKTFQGSRSSWEKGGPTATRLK